MTQLSNESPPALAMLTLRQEVALRFTTAIVAPMAEKILNVEDNEAVDASYRLLAKEGFAMADAFLAVAGELLPPEHPL